MKNESDEELECREHRFVLYSDDGMFFCKSRNNLVNNSSQAWTDIYAWLLFIVYKNVRTTLLRNRMSGDVWIGNKSIYPLSDIDMTGIFMYD